MSPISRLQFRIFRSW